MSFSLSISLYVVTELPYSADNAQQLGRKRHIGNDIVVIVYNECADSFNPSWIRSNFNHVFVVVQPDRIDDAELNDDDDDDGGDKSDTIDSSSSNNKSCRYKVGIVCKAPMGKFPPHLPTNGIFVDHENSVNFREWLLTKLINAERASYHAPAFKGRIQGTRKALLKQVIDKHGKGKE
eukprot:TRINITY_DN934_c0_g8_i2.p2 TRINITY_DN934_c0_g8~~TRINITY_DN934_c0_g8_i2.p2  ORF type:complete len:178 (+),score=96.25 TRINITY_DN934_c0_g8_i2:221-754(+)